MAIPVSLQFLPVRWYVSLLLRVVVGYHHATDRAFEEVGEVLYLMVTH